MGTSKALPQLLVGFFNSWPLLWHREFASGSATPAHIIPPLAAGFWFYGIVLLRLRAVTPVRGSFPSAAANTWALFVGYSVWLGFSPPSSRGWIGWSAWLLAVAAAIGELILFL